MSDAITVIVEPPEESTPEPQSEQWTIAHDRIANLEQELTRLREQLNQYQLDHSEVHQNLNQEVSSAVSNSEEAAEVAVAAVTVAQDLVNAGVPEGPVPELTETIEVPPIVETQEPKIPKSHALGW